MQAVRDNADLCNEIFFFNTLPFKEDPWTRPPVSVLASRFDGQLLLPNDKGYDRARGVHNGLIDKRPELIACCRTVADVVDAVAPRA